MPYRNGPRTVSPALVRAGVGRSSPSSSSKAWLPYPFNFPSGKKGPCRGTEPQQWVPAVSLCLDSVVTGESRYDWTTD